MSGGLWRRRVRTTKKERTAVLGGNAKPTAKDVSNILGVVGIKADEAEISKVLADVEGKSLDDLVKAGLPHLVGASGPVSSGKGGAGGAGGAKKADEPEPEPEEEEEEMDMGFSLFD